MSESLIVAKATTAFRHYHAVGTSHPGWLRAHNEDAILAKDELCLWVVADGMGGHSAGDVASQLVVDELANITLNADLLAATAGLEDKLISINSQLRAQGAVLGEKIVGSTVTTIFACDEAMACLWVGDSRAYHWRPGVAGGTHEGEFKRINQDHREAGLNARNQPSHMLTRALGAAERVVPQLQLIDSMRGDRVLICSDGLTDELSDSVIAATLAEHEDMNIAVEILRDRALNAGGRDNTSLILIEVT